MAPTVLVQCGLGQLRKREEERRPARRGPAGAFVMVRRDKPQPGEGRRNRQQGWADRLTCGESSRQEAAASEEQRARAMDQGRR